MSKNYSHDNIYSILGKLNALKPTAQEKHDATVKAIYESVEAQGSILQGVDAVQARLLKEFAEGKDEGKPGKNFAKIAKSAGKEYGSKAAGERVAGAVRAKLAKQGKLEETDVEEKAPPGAKAERMVKGIKKSLSKDGHLSNKDKAIAYATTWKAHNKGQVEEEYDREADVKNVAQSYMQANGIQSVHDLEPEDIEYIGSECQCNYEGVCEILGCELPDSLGPVQSWDTDEQGNKFDLEEVGQRRGMHGEPEWVGIPGPAKGTKPSPNAITKGADREYYKAPGLGGTTRTTWRKKTTAEGVCAECGMTEGSCEHTMAEAEITRTAGKTVHRKTEFPGYPADDADDLDNLRGPGAGKRGRPRKHAAKVATGLGRGRPVKAKAPTYSKQADPFGRVSGTVPKGKKGTVHSMAESMDAVTRRLIEGVNFAELLREKHQTVEEMLSELSNDIAEFKKSGYCSELLRDCMEIKGYHSKMVADEAVQTVPPAVPPSQGIPGNLPIPGKMDRLNQRGPDYYEEDAMADELNELAKLAGLQTAEGNAFTGKLASTPKGGSFELDGKTFKDTSGLGEDDMEEGNAFSGAVARAKADGVQPGEKINVGGREYPVKEAEVDVDEPNEDDLANDPEEQYGTVKQITTQGDDMNRQKRQDPHTANKAANPLTNPTMTLEARLAAEYESIKKISQ